MSYFTFHLSFLVPPILGMLLLYQRPEGFNEDHRVHWAIPVVCLLALTYTTPWDNYLVAREIWWYGPDRVVATIGYVPVEEYLFFVLQPVLTGLVVYQYLGRMGAAPKPTSTKASWTGAGVFAALTALGGLLLLRSQPNGLYMGLILLWAPPILAGMWLYDGETLWALRTTLLVTTALPTLYLWAADAIAINTQIWTISQVYTLGVTGYGLPVEEASFFLFTNLLVVQGILLLFYGSHEAVAPHKTIVNRRR